jgi:Tol biopolymer transport system component
VEVRRLLLSLAVLTPVGLASHAGASAGGAPTGALPLVADGPTARVSVSATGGQLSDGGSKVGAESAAISANGRFVAFVSSDTTVVSPPCPGGGPTAGLHAYLRDQATGRVEMISLDTKGCQVYGTDPHPSADGRFVLFTGKGRDVYGHDVVPGLTSPQYSLALYVRDRKLRRTFAVSVGMDHRLNNSDALDASMSPDGRFVAFDSGATNLVPGIHLAPNGLYTSIYVRDLRTGRTELVGRVDARVNGHRSYAPSISANGRFVAFTSTDNRLTPNPGFGEEAWEPFDTEWDGGAPECYLYDRVARRFQLMSHDAMGHLGNSWCLAPRSGQAISDDGRYAVFTDASSNLGANAALPDDAIPTPLTDDGTPDVYLYDRVTDRLTRLSTGPGDTPANGGSTEPAISGDGKVIAFASEASNLGDADATWGAYGWIPLATSMAGGRDIGADIYVRDRVSGVTRLTSRSTDGVPGDFASRLPTLSRDGRVVAFVSEATNLVAGDSNNIADAFIHVRNV